MAEHPAERYMNFHSQVKGDPRVRGGPSGPLASSSVPPSPAAGTQTELLPKARSGGGSAQQPLTFADVPHVLAVLYVVDHLEQGFLLLFHGRCCVTESLYPEHG